MSALQSLPLPMRDPRDFRARRGESSGLSKIALVAGSSAARRLTNKFAGRRVYVPENPVAGDHLARAIGLSAALRLARVFGGERIPIPADPNRAQRRERILLMRQRGFSISTIAGALRVSERYVYKVLAKERKVQNEAAAGAPRNSKRP